MSNSVTCVDRLVLDRSLEIYDRARMVIPGATQTISKRPIGYALGAYPIYLDRAEGAHVWDVDGNEYIDYVLACGPILLGYNYPAVNEAIRRQLKKGISFGQLTPMEVQAAEAVVEAVPCAEMVRFFKGGAEGNAAAVRIARAFTHREKVASCGYRGWLDQWAVAYGEDSRKGIPRVLEEYNLPFDYNDLDSLEEIFERNPGQIAAVILEPAQVGEASREFLVGIRNLTSAYGAVLIFDEVVTGFRLARGGAQEYFDVIPDIAVFAKALANGMPLSAVVGRHDIMQLAEGLFITLTYGDEGLSLAAAVAALEEMRTKDVHSYLWATGGQLMRGLAGAAKGAGISVECKGLAPMSQLVLDEQAISAKQVTTTQVWTFLLQEMARRGILWRRGGINFISYSHTEEDIEYTIRMAQEVFLRLREVLDSGDLVASTFARPAQVGLQR